MKKNHIILVLAMLLISCVDTVYSQERNPATQFDRTVHVTVHSNALDEDRDLFIYTPEGSSTAQFPVLYILDGHHIEYFTESLAATRTNPHIIVGIPGGRNRNLDMIPVVMPSRPASGGSDKFLEFIVSELQPYIDHRYKTSGENILYGGSNAALFTIYAMLTEPDHFFAYIAASAMIGHCSEYMISKVNQFAPANRLNGKFLYNYYGMKDEYKQVTEYLPDFTHLMSVKLPQLNIATLQLANGIHVPSGVIRDGLNYIYNHK